MGRPHTPRSRLHPLTVALSLLLLAGAGCDISNPLPEGEDPQGVEGPFPVVMAHGFFGFEDFAGIDFINYFFGVQSALAEAGEVVFTPPVDPFNASAVRGEMLLAAVEAVLEETGAAKVNIIGHSQGGLDARWVAHVRPDLVASVTTIATPHRGTLVADVALGIADRGPLPDLLDALTILIGAPIWDAVGGETSVTEATRTLSSAGADLFNAEITDAAGVSYYSIAGRTDLHRGGAHCRVDDSPAFLARWEDNIDPVDPLLLVTEALLDGGLFDPIPNDGLVPVPSTKWGRFLGCIPADHLDQMGHLVGDLPGLINPFRHRVFYQDLIGWLRTQGH